MTVLEPWFMQESQYACRQQAYWMKANLNLDEEFFSSVLNIDAKSWFAGADLEDRTDYFDFWRAVRHVLSFYGWDVEKVKYFLEVEIPHTDYPHPNHPIKWHGTSLKEYLKINKVSGIVDLDCWITGLRFK